MNKNLIILRGLPGAGKSTFAELISGGNPDVVCTADDYFMVDGEYKFDPSKLGMVHSWCREKCENLMKKDAPLVIVANTNVREQHFAEYIDMAKKYGYRWFSIVVENRHGGKSIHNVPSEKVNLLGQIFNIKL